MSKSDDMLVTGLMKHNCATCKWSDTDQIGDRYCCNDESEKCADFVDKDTVCEYWEETDYAKN